MIPVEKLRAVRTVVTHDNCPDGRASAMVLHAVLPDAGIIFARHGSSELATLPATPGMLFVDFTPPPGRVAEFVEAGAVVLDHHVGQRSIVEAFGESGVFADEAAEPGVCGAVLAYRHVWCPLASVSILHATGDVGEFVTLAGIRDTWQRKDPRWVEACAQAEALRFWPWEHLASLAPDEWIGATQIGRVLLRKRQEAVTFAISRAERLTIPPDGFDGSPIATDLRCVLVATLETSDVMDRLEGEADVVLGFGYHVDADRRRLVVSCRSRSFDVSALAKRYGGGGHTLAAGFTVDVEEGALNPFDHVWGLLSAHLEAL